MRVLCVLGKYQYGDPKRKESAEYMSFLPAFQRLGHEVYHFESRDRRRQTDLPSLNRDLLSRVEELKPAIIFTVQGSYEIWLDTWKIIAGISDAALINWTTDDSWKYDIFSTYIAPYFDVITTTYPYIVPKYRRDGHHNVFLTQWAASARNLAPPLPASDCVYEVSFVGTAHGSRRKHISFFQQKGIPVKCFGHGWAGGAVAAKEMYDVIRRSKISLNFANSRGANQIKARVFEIPGAGGFLLTENAPELERYYRPQKEVAVFADAEDAAHQIEFYLSNPQQRDSLAISGFERTAAEHTYDQRMSDLVSYALEARNRRNSVKQADAWTEMDEAVRSHQLHRYHLLIRNSMLRICKAIWGRERGPRAARRFVYESSVRLVGMKTYSSLGWPGRLFPGI